MGIRLQGYASYQTPIRFTKLHSGFLSRQRYDESNPSASHDLANHIYSLETQKKYTYS